MDYVIGVIFIVLALTGFNLLGKSLLKSESTFSKRLMIGYVFYVSLQAIIGIVTQVFRIDFSYYRIAMIILCVLLFALIIKRANLSHNGSLKESFLKHLKQYRIIYIITLVLVACSLLNLTYLWLGNHQDDGLYLLKVALAPTLGGNYDVNYATGFTENLALSRAINTFELDYAFWSNLLGISPSVFCKVIMAFVNYVLVLNGFNLLIQTIKKDKQEHASYFLLSILFFAITPETLTNHNILSQQDAWHFNTAIWYGSGIVRCLGPILLLFPFLGGYKITKSNFIWFGVTALALMSRASQALPMIYLISASIMIFTIVKYIIHKNHQLLSVLALAILLIVLFILPAPESLSLYASTVFTIFFKSKIILGSLFAVVILPFVVKNREMRKLTSIFIIMLVLTAVPQMNALFIKLSTVDFVIGRTLTMFSFYFILLAAIYMGILIHKFIKIEWINRSIYILFAVACVGLYSISMISNFGFFNVMGKLVSNPYMVPNSTVHLSRILESVAKDVNDKLYVLGPSWVNIDGFSHVLGTTLRIDAPSIYSISAVHRFPNISEDSVFKFFDMQRQTVYENFSNDPNDAANQKAMVKLLNDFPVNVIYDVDKEVCDVLEKKFSYHVIQKVEESKTYYVLVDDNIYQQYLNRPAME